MDSGTQASLVSMATDGHAPQEMGLRHSDHPLGRALPLPPLPHPGAWAAGLAQPPSSESAEL